MKRFNRIKGHPRPLLLSPKRCDSISNVNHLVFNKPNLKSSLAFYLDNSQAGRAWELIDTFINLFFVINYVQQTQYVWRDIDQYSSEMRISQSIDLVLAILLLIQHLPSIYISFNQIGAFFSFYSLLTYLSTIPVFIAFGLRTQNIGSYFGCGVIVYLYPFRFWRLKQSIAESVSPNKNFLLNLSPIAMKATEVILSIFITLATVTSWVHLILWNVQRKLDITFFEVFYTIIVTSTTGLNTDLVPDSVYTRAVVLGIMIVGAIFIPANLSELLTLMSQKSKYDSGYNPRRKREKLRKKLGHNHDFSSKHVLISGNICDVGALRGFLREFFCEDHGPSTLTTKIIILQPNEPTEQMQALLNDVLYAERCQYVKGTVISSESLKKVKAEDCEGCFLLTSKFGTDGDLELIDSNTVLRAHAIKKYYPNITLYVQVLLPKNITHFQNLADHILCVDAFKLGILAQNCLSPGFINLITVLTTSVSAESRKQFAYKSHGVNHNQWINEYLDGAINEIYTIRLSMVYKGVKYEDLVSDIYKTFGSCLFALGLTKRKLYPSPPPTTTANTKGDTELNIPIFEYDEENDEEDSSIQIFLNPIGYILKGGETAYLISTKRSIVDQIAAGLFRMSRDRLVRFEDENDNIETTDEFSFLNEENYDFNNLQTTVVTENIAGASSTEITPLLTPQQQRPRSGSGISIPRNEKVTSSKGGNPDLFSLEQMRLKETDNFRMKQKVSLDDLVFRGPKAFATDMVGGFGSEVSIAGGGDGAVPPFVHDHILICDLSSSFPANLSYFIAVYRHKDPNSHIVLLSMEKPGADGSDGAVEEDDESEHPTIKTPENWDAWDWLKVYGNIHHVSGSPLSRKDLMRCNITSIQKAVILCDPFEYESGDKLADSNALLALLNIEELSLKEDVFVTVEFVDEQNMKVIGKEDFRLGPDEETLELFGCVAIPSFIGGHSFSHSVLHSLLCQVFYNSHLLHVCDRLIFNCGSEQFRESGVTCSPLTNSELISVNSSTSNKFEQFPSATTIEECGHFAQIDLPDQFISLIRKFDDQKTQNVSIREFFDEGDEDFGLCYGQLFHFLLVKEKTLALGLYRRTFGDQINKYTVVNAPEGLKLRVDDKIFVLR